MNFLEFVGVCTMSGVIIFILMIAYSSIKEVISNMLTHYKIKKRFKKTPTAACYCRDCKKWDPETGKCWDPCNTRLMGAEWFCCFAVPLTGDRFKEREKQFKESGRF